MEVLTLTGEMTNANYDECIESCSECYKICRAAIRHCLYQDKKIVKFLHITALMDCADICQMTSRLLMSDSRSALEAGKLCSKVCEATAELLNLTDDSDETLQLCADTCFQCGLICKELPQMGQAFPA
jgi:hypothetical protein